MKCEGKKYRAHAKGCCSFRLTNLKQKEKKSALIDAAITTRSYHSKDPRQTHQVFAKKKNQRRRYRARTNEAKSAHWLLFTSGKW